MDSDREVIRRRIALRERDGHERLLLNHEALRDLLDAAHGYVVAYGARCEHSDDHTGRGAPGVDGWRRLLAARADADLRTP